MPSLESFFKLTRTLVLEWPEQQLTLTVHYKQLAYTPEFTDELERSILREDGTSDGFLRLTGTLRRLIASWDLTDSKGKSYPLDDDSLRKLPTQILNELYVALYEDMRVNPLKRRPIESASAPTAPPESTEPEPGPSALPSERALTPVS